MNNYELYDPEYCDGHYYCPNYGAAMDGGAE